MWLHSPSWSQMKNQKGVLETLVYSVVQVSIAQGHIFQDIKVHVLTNRSSHSRGRAVSSIESGRADDRCPPLCFSILTYKVLYLAIMVLGFGLGKNILNKFFIKKCNIQQI